ncbi:MAG: hypothetical protein J5756_03590 [Clostridia bacterium]|nr:hypothetical protein [Clostridia bacterium]
MSDKVFTKKMTLSICLIILCLCALSISAGAYFTDSKNSQAKTFSTATFVLNVDTRVITDTTTTPVTLAPDPVAADSAEHTYTLAANANGYKATISIDSAKTSTNKSGYCRIEIYKNNTKIATYCTEQIAKNNSSVPAYSKSVTIKSDVDITVKFIPLWGTYSGTYGTALADGATITIAGDTVTPTPVNP